MPEKPKSKVRPVLPSGFRDFGPQEVRRRRAVFDTLIRLFERFGYEPLETPAVELLSVLLGKYGEEGDRLLFRILNSGDFLEGVPPEAYRESRALLPYITEKALRYDLTVPMARWVAQHAGQLVFPFKRYQIQPVWRADRPQRGRFREFYQCDADIVGAEGLVPLLEMVALVREGLTAIGVQGAVFHLNHRALLEQAALETGWPADQLPAFCTILDKADKIGWPAVQQLFVEQGYTLPAWLDPKAPPEVLWNTLQAIPSLAADLTSLRQLLQAPTDAMSVRWDVTLARGLEYYTGYVYEVRVPGSGVGSIAAGGAYASLVKEFGGPDLPAMGISFGIERILTLLEQQTPASAVQPQPVLVAWIDASPSYIYRVVKHFHQAGIAAFAFPAPKKLKAQLDYAQRRGLRWVAIVGATEEAHETFQLRDLIQHTQVVRSLNEPPLP